MMTKKIIIINLILIFILKYLIVSGEDKQSENLKIISTKLKELTSMEAILDEKNSLKTNIAILLGAINIKYNLNIDDNVKSGVKYEGDMESYFLKLVDMHNLLFVIEDGVIQIKINKKNIVIEPPTFDSEAFTKYLVQNFENDFVKVGDKEDPKIYYLVVISEDKNSKLRLYFLMNNGTIKNGVVHLFGTFNFHKKSYEFGISDKGDNFKKYDHIAQGKFYSLYVFDNINVSDLPNDLTKLIKFGPVLVNQNIKFGRIMIK